jgi:hypothetical protein
MIKQLHEILLRDVILLDATKSASHLKKYWFIPLFLCRKELEKLAKDIFSLIGGQTVDQFDSDLDKLLSIREIHLLEALYKAVQSELILRPQINVWKLILDKEYKESAQLEEVLKEVKNHTGIEIKEPKDLKDFEQYVQLKIDKHNETYTQKEEPKEEIPLTEILYSVFNCLKEPWNEDMRLITYKGLKQRAENMIKQKHTDTEQE